uniref:Uncharacterized protein n=1 Tax=Brassica oleracea var. oleracea TaxID=109376 RepID=A0A0D3CBS6_BRAOL
MNKKLRKWSGAYDNARRMQQSGWSENDVLAKAHELYSSGGNTGWTSSGSKRSRESDASDSNSVGSNSVGSSVRPMGTEAPKKKAKRKAKAHF